MYASNGILQRISPDTVEHEYFVVMMAAATGLAEEFLETLIWNLKTRRYFAKFLTPAGKARSPRHNHSLTGNADWHADSYCPECLADDFYLRRLWRPAFSCVCLIHTRVLVDECLGCRAVLGFYGERQLNRDSDQNHTILLCQQCGFDLTTVPRRLPAPQHLNLITLLSRFYDEQVQTEQFHGGAVILRIFHWWMEAFFQTSTALPKPPMVFRNARRAQQRAAYTYQSCRVRYALFEAACKAIGRAGQNGLPWESEDSDCMDWLGPRKWNDFCGVAKRLTDIFPELLDQRGVAAPDRSILPPP